MSFVDNIPGVRTRAFIQIGTPATYLSLDLMRVWTDCTVHVRHNSVLNPSSFDVQVVEVGTTIKALISEVGTPEKGGKFTVDSTVYTVQRVESNDGTFITMWVTE